METIFIFERIKNWIIFKCSWHSKLDNFVLHFWTIHFKHITS